jgi:hypothetical protein
MKIHRPNLRIGLVRLASPVASFRERESFTSCIGHIKAKLPHVHEPGFYEWPFRQEDS